MKSFLSLWAAWRGRYVQELPHWMHILQTLLPLEAEYSSYHPSDPHSVHWYIPQALQLSAALLAPLQDRTSTTSTGTFVLCLLGFWVLTQPCTTSILNSQLLPPLCVCTAEISGGATFPYIILLHFLQVWATYLHAYGHTLWGQLEPPSPSLGEDQDHLCSLGTSCYSRTAQWQVAGSKHQGILFSSLQDTEPSNREKGKYPSSQLTLRGSLSKRKLSLQVLSFPENLESGEARGAPSPLARSCKGQILNFPSAPLHMEAPASATGRMLRLLRSCASLSPKMARAHSGGEGNLFCYYTLIQGTRRQQKITDRWPLYVATALCLAL